MRLLLVLFSFFAIASANAQPVPPAALPFVPYTITEQQHQALMQYLTDELPAKWSRALIQNFQQWEQQAQVAKAQAEAAEKAKAEAAKKPPEPKKP